jgi:ERCC4-related helicase
MKKKDRINQSKEGVEEPSFDFIFKDFSFSNLSTSFILSHCAEPIPTEDRGAFEIQIQEISLNSGSFLLRSYFAAPLEVSVSLEQNQLTLSCPCTAPKYRLCEHQAQVLFHLMRRSEIKVFFDDVLREEKLKQAALDYGLENERQLDDFFELKIVNQSLEIQPRLKGLLSPAQLNDKFLEDHVVPSAIQTPPEVLTRKDRKTFVVISQHRFYKHLCLGLFEAQMTKTGKVKNPLRQLAPTDFIWQTDQPEALKFFTAISSFQSSYSEGPSQKEIEALRSLIKNPLGMEAFYHDSKLSENITASSLVPVKLSNLNVDLRLFVEARDNFYEVNAELVIGGRSYPLDVVKLSYTYFILLDHTLYLIDKVDFLRVIDFFRSYSNKILIHKSKFEDFRNRFLLKLEHTIKIVYSYLKQATEAQLQETGFYRTMEKMVYLAGTSDYVLITPVVKYGDIEIPALSQRQLYAFDLAGEPFTVERNSNIELQLIGRLLRQHPDFKEQLHMDHFYLHKSRFMDENWFLDAFEDWQGQGIKVLGFNELYPHKLNPHKGKISVTVTSGINWFDTKIALQFGQQKVKLKHLQKAVRNKNKFIPLDDGTMGILPEEWLEKFTQYFQLGEVKEETLRTPKVNFFDIAHTYDEEYLNAEVKAELSMFKSKVAGFKGVEQVEVPGDLKATLRDYQKDGLNWLNFLDEFNFGGCLADDMGLGKTIQIIAFILSQRNKTKANTNLVVVPTSLVFNWQAEVEKYAPSLKVLKLHGASRSIDIAEFDSYEIILTTYGTLLNDVRWLKKYRFNCIILDESQAIKNPDSQRYKAACLLQSRNKILMTGTPIENHTFDLYGQLSFACPGLLGTKQYFREHYSTPIDKFKNKKRAQELQQKTGPFILGRTKEQVAKELPEKTEVVIYCQMGAEQRKVYDAYAQQYRDYLQHKKDDDIAKHSMHILKGLTKLRQICNATALLSDEPAYGYASAKIEVLMEQVESKAPDHKILIFSQFVSMLELIKAAFEKRKIAYQYLTGQTKDRAGQVEAFQTNEDVRVFLISLKAGGTGLNLIEADYVYLVDPWWNPAVENQAIDRSHRIGQDKTVVAVRLIAPDTIEEKIRTLQESKKILADELVGDGNALLKSFSKAELLDLFG